jgi:hypothetical protein
MKTNLIALFILMATFQLQAQQGPYLRLGGGYSISAANDVFTNTTLVRDSSGIYTSDANIYGTLGNGAHFRLIGGYTFKQNFGVELEVEYLWGARNNAGLSTAVGRELTTTAYTRQLRLAPSFYVQASPGLIQPYAGFGLLLPVNGKTVVEELDVSTATTTLQVREINGALSLGFNAFAGVNINYPNDKFQIFFEVRHSNMRIKSKKATTVQWDRTDNNTGEVTNLLDGADTYSTEILFQDELTPESNTVSATVTSGTNFDFDKPLELLASKTNFNALSFNIGVKIHFTKGADGE